MVWSPLGVAPPFLRERGENATSLTPSYTWFTRGHDM